MNRVHIPYNNSLALLEVLWSSVKHSEKLQGKNPKDINNISEENKAELEKLGYDEWFESKNRENFKDGFSTARIVEVNRNNYKVSNGRHEMVAELSGKFLFNVENSIDHPTVGDWVIIQCFDNYSLAIIHLTFCYSSKR